MAFQQQNKIIITLHYIIHYHIQLLLHIYKYIYILYTQYITPTTVQKDIIFKKIKNAIFGKMIP